jgi:hypothetical protein
MFLRRFFSVVALWVVFCAPQLARSQENPNAAPPSELSPRPYPGPSPTLRDNAKAEFFGGYSRYDAGGSVNGITVPNFVNGWGGQFILPSTNRTALVVDFGRESNSTASAFSIAAGPQFRFHIGRVTPFIEGMLGVQDFSPKQYPGQKAATYMLGSGFDFRLTRRIAIRPIHFDYINTYYSALSPSGKNNPFNGYRLQSGIILNLGLPSQEGEVSAACSVGPAMVDAGSPVSITVAPKGFVRGRTLRYDYKSTGGKVAPSKMAASVDTTGVQPGVYTVTANVADNATKKHHQTASCQVRFAVKAVPAAAKTAAANSATENAAGEAAIVDEKHPPAPPVSPAPESAKSGTATDDQNLTTSISAAVKVVPPPEAKKFGSIEFVHDARRPTRVDNVAKGELDRYADALAAAPYARGVVVGYATARENELRTAMKQAPDFAPRRAVNTKDYLSRDKGIDASRIEPRAGRGLAHGKRTVELWIVSAGATFPKADTNVVDESQVKAVPRVARTTRKRSSQRQIK